MSIHGVRVGGGAPIEDVPESSTAQTAASPATSGQEAAVVRGGSGPVAARDLSAQMLAANLGGATGTGGGAAAAFEKAYSKAMRSHGGLSDEEAFSLAKLATKVIAESATPQKTHDELMGRILNEDSAVSPGYGMEIASLFEQALAQAQGGPAKKGEAAAAFTKEYDAAMASDGGLSDEEALSLAHVAAKAISESADPNAAYMEYSGKLLNEDNAVSPGYGEQIDGILFSAMSSAGYENANKAAEWLRGKLESGSLPGLEGVKPESVAASDSESDSWYVSYAMKPGQKDSEAVKAALSAAVKDELGLENVGFLTAADRGIFEGFAKGDRGPQVAEFQNELKTLAQAKMYGNAMSAALDPGAADGIFGANTEKAVRAFQKLFPDELIVDGTMNEATYIKLADEVARAKGGHGN